MNNNISLKIVVAETSVIIRSGLAAVLKRIPNLNAHPIEVSSPEALQNFIHLHTPDIVIVNPTFGGWFDLPSFKTNHNGNSIKYIALVCSVIDNNALKEYDESIAICDDIEMITRRNESCWFQGFHLRSFRAIIREVLRQALISPRLEAPTSKGREF